MRTEPEPGTPAMLCAMRDRDGAGNCDTISEGGVADFLPCVLVDGRLEPEDAVSLCSGHLTYWHEIFRDTIFAAYGLELSAEKVLKQLGVDPTPDAPV